MNQPKPVSRASIFFGQRSRPPAQRAGFPGQSRPARPALSGRNQKPLPGPTGQSSMEYLVLLAIVLSLALVALAVSGVFPSFAYDAQAGDSAQYWASAAAPIAIIDARQNGTDFAAILENRANANLRLTGFSLTVQGANYSATGLPNLPPGGKAMLSLAGPSCTGRKSYAYDVQINYSTDQVAGLSQAGAKPLYIQCID